MSLTKIRARLEAATPGEWSIRPNNGGRFTLLEQQSSDPTSDEARANAALIAHAPSDLRELLGLVERCKELLKASRPLVSGAGMPTVGMSQYLEETKQLLAELNTPGEDAGENERSGT